MDECWQTAGSIPTPAYCGGNATKDATLTCVTDANCPAALPGSCVSGKCIKTDGITKAYGLVWFLLANNVRVNLIIKENKTAAPGCATPDAATDGTIRGRDFCVTTAVGAPVEVYNRTTGTFIPFPGGYTGTSIAYRGSVFVIDVNDLGSGPTSVANLLKTGTHPSNPAALFGHQVTTVFNGVRIHRALASFSAPVALTTNAPLGKLAIPVMSAVSVPVGCGGSCADTEVNQHKIMAEYLNYAGLNFVGAGGTFAAPGLVFDYVTLAEVSADALLTGGYTTVWLPHMDYNQPGITTALPKLTAFLDAGKGLFAACRAIEALETGFKCTGAACPATAGTTWAIAASSATCPAYPPSAACGGSTATRYIFPNGLANNATVGWGACMNTAGSDYGCRSGYTCSNPSTGAGSYAVTASPYNPMLGDCRVNSTTPPNDLHVYGDVGHLIAQHGDFKFLARGGSVRRFKPADASGKPLGAYPAGVTRLIYTEDNSGATVQDGWDIMVLRRKDNDPNKGPIMYLGGHIYSKNPPGGSNYGSNNFQPGALRVILNTVFHLTFAAVNQSNEANRSTPLIVGTAGNAKAIQGTFETNTVPPSMNFDGANPAGWAFPATKGHLRIFPVSNLTATVTQYQSIVNQDWDGGATGKIPAESARKVFTAVENSGSGYGTLTKKNFCPNTAGTNCPGGYNPSSGDLTTWAPILLGTGGNTTTDSNGADAYPSNFEALIRLVRAAKLGGIDRAGPAYIAGSPRVPGQTSRCPLVYAAGLDGMLHAFKSRDILTPGSGCDVGTWGDASLIEQWAFIPPNQLGLLRTNAAQIQGSPAISDVFGDFTSPADGRREWVTLMTLTQGEGGKTVYALDITNPAATGPGTLWWSSPTGMGQARGSAIGVVDCGKIPRPLVIVATNDGTVAAPTSTTAGGIKVFGLDATTGQQKWVFSSTYTKYIPGGVTYSNNIPATVTAVDKLGTGGCQTHVFVGDFQGRIWSLDAATGTSTTGSTTPLFDTGSIGACADTTYVRCPIGAPLALYRSASQQLHVVFGTGGADWSPATTVAQQVVDLNATATGPITSCSSPTCRTKALSMGERVYGGLVVSGNELFVLTALGLVDAINSWSTASAASGNAYRVNLGTFNTTQTFMSIGMGASSAGVTDDAVIIGASQGGSKQTTSGSRDVAAGSLESTGGGTLNRVRMWLQNLR